VKPLWAELCALHSRFGRANLLCLDRVVSTQTLARRIVREMREEDLSPPDSVLVALEQTGGRGRQGRGWESPPGEGLYVTLLAPPLAGTGDDETGGGVGAVSELPLRVAVGLLDALEEFVGPGVCRLKWPNDVVTGRGKLAGILIEALSAGEGRPVPLVGLGVNRGGASGGPPPHARATTLVRELGARELGTEPPPLAELAARVVESVREAIARPGGPPLDRYRELSAHRPGETLRCRVGGEDVHGTFRGFDSRGFLILERNGGREVLAAGEVIE
jgi:BirA family transcriptional regulator, biotin operon repressor / biotin---[acetyl-CoA-carboxylase] ligase